MIDILDPPALVRPAEDLAILASRINAEHEQGVGAVRRGLEHFRAAGEALLKAKAACGHGNWLKWLKGNVRFSQSMASKYMRVAAGWDKLETGSNLRDALRLLADVPPDDPAAIVIRRTVESDAIVLTFNYGSAGVQFTATGIDVLGEPTTREFFWLMISTMQLTMEIEAIQGLSDDDRKSCCRWFWDLHAAACAAHPTTGGDA